MLRHVLRTGLQACALALPLLLGAAGAAQAQECRSYCTPDRFCSDRCFFDTPTQGVKWFSCGEWTNGNCVHCWLDDGERAIGLRYVPADDAVIYVKEKTKEMVCNNGSRYIIERQCWEDHYACDGLDEGACCRLYRGCWGTDRC